MFFKFNILNNLTPDFIIFVFQGSNMTYRLVVKDKLHHVINRLQSLLTGQMHHLKNLPVPDYLELEDMDDKQLASLQLSDKLNGKYDTARIIFALKLKLQASGTITLIGVAERC